MRKNGQKIKKIYLFDYFRMGTFTCSFNVEEGKRKGLTPLEIKSNERYYCNLSTKILKAERIYHPFLLITGKQGQKAFLTPSNFKENYPSLLSLSIPPELSMTQRNQWLLIASRVFPPDLFIATYKKISKKIPIRKPWKDSRMPADLEGNQKIIFKTFKVSPGPNIEIIQKRDQAMRNEWKRLSKIVYRENERWLLMEIWINQQMQKERREFGGLGKDRVLRICRSKTMSEFI